MYILAKLTLSDLYSFYCMYCIHCTNCKILLCFVCRRCQSSRNLVGEMPRSSPYQTATRCPSGVPRALRRDGIPRCRPAMALLLSQHLSKPQRSHERLDTYLCCVSHHVGGVFLRPDNRFHRRPVHLAVTLRNALFHHIVLG